MKKYVLIKKYPGSPKLIGTEVVYTGSGYICDKHYFPIESIENHPEFWEEIVEKDYEILSYYAKNISGKGDYCVDLEYIWYETSKGNGKWSRKGYITGPYTTDEINNHNGYSIHSVKRLSDGEVFTVGDVSNFGKITGFVIRENKIVVQYYKIGDWQWLSSIKHIKQPLFKSEDGVELNYGDDCYIVHKPLNNKTTLTQLNKSKFRKELLPNHSYRLIFSSKEGAENYIDLNKPAYSKAQLLLWLDDPKEAVKELLNNK